MPEAVTAAIAWAGAEIGGEVGATLIMYSTEIATAITAVAAVGTLQDQQRRARNKQRDAYNASLRDRYVSSRGATEPRRLVLGRQRVSGPIFFVQSWGANKGTLGFCLALAAHEIDAIETIYFDDQPLTLDGSGNVTGITRREQFSLSSTGGTFTIQSTPVTGSVTANVRYGSTTVALGVSVVGTAVTVSGATAGSTGTLTISYQPNPSPYAPAARKLGTASVTLVSGSGSVTLPNVPVAGTVNVTFDDGSGDGALRTNLNAFTSVAGSLVTLTGTGLGSAVATVSYEYSDAPRARIRQYLGAPGQAADAALIAALPGVWTSAHTASGCAYIVGEMDFDPDSFPNGLPNVSAQIRGAKVYDPRTGLTAWSENPALLMRHAATHPLCGRLASSLMDDTAFAVAANACDVASAYTVNTYASDGVTVLSSQTYSRARYTAGLVVRSGTQGKNVLDDLAESMAGRWSFVNGQLRVKAGAWATPLMTLDETWLASNAPVQIQPRAPRAELTNLITGKFADEQNDYQVLPFPRVTAAAYVAEDGAELPNDVELNAVTFVGQAQQVAAVRLRDTRQGLRVTFNCNMRAFPVEWGDTIYVTLARFGWVLKPFEVLETAFGIDGGISIQAKETSSTIFDLGTAFTSYDPAPNTLLASPFDLPAVTGLGFDSSSAVQTRNADGTIVQRMRVSWTPITAQAVVAAGGGIEVRYGVAGTAESAWRSVFAEGGSSQIDIVPVQQGQTYLVKARSYNALANGAWSLPIVAAVSAQSLQVGTAQLTAQAATLVRTVAMSGTSVTGYGRSYNPSGIPSLFPVVNSWTTIASDTFTPTVNGEAEITVSGVATFTVGSHVATFDHPATAYSVAYTVNGGAESGITSVDQSATVGTTYSVPLNLSRRVSLTGGVSVTLAIRAQKAFDDDTMTVGTGEVRFTVIYR